MTSANSERTYYADHTEYPNIYFNSYWGQIPERNPVFEIIINRNEFIKEYEIKHYASRVPEYVSKYTNLNYIDEFTIQLESSTQQLNQFLHGYQGMPLDHAEYYITQDDDWILLISPYDDIHEDDAILLSKLGWEKYKKMYSEHATTYILRIPGFKAESFEPIMRKLIRKFDDPNVEEYNHEFVEDGWNYYIRKSKQVNDIYVRRSKIGKKLNKQQQLLQTESAYMCDDKVVTYSCSGCRVKDIIFSA